MFSQKEARIYNNFHLSNGKNPYADPECEHCGGSGNVEHSPLHPDGLGTVSPCVCLGSDEDYDNTPEE